MPTLTIDLLFQVGAPLLALIVAWTRLNSRSEAHDKTITRLCERIEELASQQELRLVEARMEKLEDRFDQVLSAFRSELGKVAADVQFVRGRLEGR